MPIDQITRKLSIWMMSALSNGGLSMQQRKETWESPPRTQRTRPLTKSTVYAGNVFLVLYVTIAVTTRNTKATQSGPALSARRTIRVIWIQAPYVYKNLGAPNAGHLCHLTAHAAKTGSPLSVRCPPGCVTIALSPTFLPLTCTKPQNAGDVRNQKSLRLQIWAFMDHSFSPKGLLPRKCNRQSWYRQPHNPQSPAQAADTQPLPWRSRITSLITIPTPTEWAIFGKT